MKFTAKEDIAAPADYVFDSLCNADRLERMVRQKGGKITRTPQGPLVQGSVWDGEIPFRGSVRSVSLTITNLTRPHKVLLVGGGAAFDLTVQVDVVALSGLTTRLSVETEAKPKTLAARLMIQSVKLAKGAVLTRYRKRISSFAAMIEKEHRTS